MAPIALKMRFIDGRTEALTVDGDATVAALKADMAPKAGVGAERLRVVFSGHVLKDENTIASYGITDGSTVHVVKAAANNAQADAAAAAAATAAPAARSPVGATAAGGPRPGIPASLSRPNSMAAMQQQLQQNPDMMRQLLNSPITEMMMNNPEIMRRMMLANPEMQELTQRNPELAHLLNDPALLRQSLEIARNPSMMLEQQRNNDRAMQNIEMLPGGFDALRRMYTDVQEPLMAAQVSAGGMSMSNMRGVGTPTQPSRTTPERPAAEGVLPGQRGPDGHECLPEGTLPGPERGGGRPPATTPNTAPLPNPWAPAAAGRPAASPGFGALPGFGGLPAGTAPGRTLPGGAAGAAPGLASPPFGPFGWAPPPWAGGGADDDDMNDPAFVQAVGGQLATSVHAIDAPTLTFDLGPAGDALRIVVAQLLESMAPQGAAGGGPASAPWVPAPGTLYVAPARYAALHVGGPTESGGCEVLVPAVSLPRPHALARPSAGSPLAAWPTLPWAAAVRPRPVDWTQYEARFASQLAFMSEMGFQDKEANIAALLAAGGNVDAAVDRMIATGAAATGASPASGNAAP